MVKFIFLVALLSPAFVQADAELYRLITERLLLMKPVAAYKWVHQLPIEDLDREKIVIDRAISDGLVYSINVDASESFFTAQIEAAKDIQSCWFTRWRIAGAPNTADDVANIIRPKLISLGREITAHLVDTDSAHKDNINHSFQPTVDCLSIDQKNNIVEALQAITTYPDRLTQIKHSKRLRIGTTGDYAPFSMASVDGGFEGIDIDLARDLADALDSTPMFGQASWPTLMQDLAAGTFDIAMNRVSLTKTRAREALFSIPYHTGGKTPISLCSRSQEFNTIDRIDQIGVSLIVNPGGTNEKFVNRKITRASIRLHRNNRTIFDEIITGRADLMITDAIEVQLQVARHPELCATMPGKTLNLQEKAYMMPIETSLLTAVNRWLKGKINDGTRDRVFATHLSR